MPGVNAGVVPSHAGVWAQAGRRLGVDDQPVVQPTPAAAVWRRLGVDDQPVVQPTPAAAVLIELCTRELGARRGEWRLPHAPEECPQVCAHMAGMWPAVRRARINLRPCLAVCGVPHSSAACLGCLPAPHAAAWRPPTCACPALLLGVQEVVDLISECVQADAQLRPTALQTLVRLRATGGNPGGCSGCSDGSGG